jgi:thiol-disulfide isomerase/thioredoxin
MSRRLRLLLLSPVFRWTLVLVVLLVAGAIAFWPRQQQESAQSVPLPSPSKQAGPARSDLPCPPSAASGAKPALGGTTASCLGDGTRVDAASALAARDGKPTVVNVWASWCPPCREELPVLQRYADRERAGSGGANLVGIQIDSDPAEGRALLAKLGVRFPMLYDTGEAVSKRLGVPYALPASYVIDTRGRVHFVGQPRVFRTVSDVQQAVAGYGGADG